MNKLQENLLEIVLEIDRICRKHDINYFLDSGTALGAVRHGGFIPWDDDADIGMPREDYEKFITVAKEELNDKYFLQIPETEPNYFLTYAKIRKNNTKYVESATKKIKMHQGIFVDIFPYDVLPQDGAKERYRYMSKLRYEVYEWGVPSLASMPQKNISYKIRSVGRYVKYLILHLRSRDKLLSRFNSECIKYNGLVNDRFLTTSFSYGMNSTGKYYLYPVNILETEDIEFENHKLRISKNIHEYLEITYGSDYMELPPEEDRYQHNAVEVKFE